MLGQVRSVKLCSITEVVSGMIVIEEQLLLDLDYLGVQVEVGVGPGPVEVLAYQVTPAAQTLLFSLLF